MLCTLENFEAKNVSPTGYIQTQEVYAWVFINKSWSWFTLQFLNYSPFRSGLAAGLDQLSLVVGNCVPFKSLHCFDIFHNTSIFGQISDFSSSFFSFYWFIFNQSWSELHVSNFLWLVYINLIFVIMCGQDYLICYLNLLENTFSPIKSQQHLAILKTLLAKLGDRTRFDQQTNEQSETDFGAQGKWIAGSEQWFLIRWKSCTLFIAACYDVPQSHQNTSPWHSFEIFYTVQQLLSIHH